MKPLRLRTMLILGCTVLLAGCAVPGGPGVPTGKVILHTPYGNSSRSVIGDYFQSSVVPQNLEAAVSSFDLTLSGNAGAPISKTVAFDDAALIAFEDVPQGQWDLKVEGRNSLGSVVARGEYKSFFVVNGTLTDIPDLVTVSPTRPVNPGPEAGDFRLTLRQVPAAVKKVGVEYTVVFIKADGSFDLVDRFTNTSDILTSSLSLPSSGYRTFTIQTNTSRYGGKYYGEQTGTFLLKLTFENDDGTLVHSFQPVFTVDIYQNLESTLDLTLPANLSNVSPPAVSNVSVTTDVQGGAVVHWARPAARNTVTAFQIAQTAVGSNTDPTNAEILATVPNLGNLSTYATNINLAQQPGSTAQFWVRAVSSGLYPSSWTPVTATANLTMGDPYDLFVSTTGSDAADGSKNAPLASIQKAIDLAQLRGNYGQETRIFVAEGSYNLSAGLINKPRNVDGLGGIEAAVPVSLLGGYYNGFTQRGDPANHATVLFDTRATGDAASNFAEIFFDQTGAPSLPTPQTIDGFTIEQTLGTLAGDSFVGVWVDGAIDLTVSNLKILQNAPSNGLGSGKGVQIQVNRTDSSPARTIVVQNNRIVQKASGSTNSTPAAVSWQGIGVGLGSGVQSPTPAVRVENNLVVHEATSKPDNISINLQPMLGTIAVRQNTVVTDLVSSQVAMVISPASVQVGNNLFVNANIGFGSAFGGTGLLTGQVFLNNAASGFANLYWDGTTGVSLAGLNNHSTSSGNITPLVGQVVFQAPGTNDYRLSTSSSPAVLNGGRDGSQETPPWPSTTDLAGQTRTAPWTVGAYETDLFNLGVSFGTARPADYTFPVNADRNAFALSDVNNDGTLDAVINIGPSSTGIKVYTQSPLGTFTLNQQLSNQTGGNNYGVYALTVGKLKNNPYPAIVTGGPNGDIYSPNAVFNNASGVFTINGTTTYTSNGTAFYGFRVATGNLNGDAYDDVVWSDPSYLYVGLSNGSGGFSTLISYPKTGPGSEINSLVLADLDGDGDLDVTTPRTYNGEGQQGSVLLFLNNGNGTFAACVVEPSAASTYLNPWALAVADVTGDGKSDLLLTSNTSWGATDPMRDLWIGKRESADGATPVYSFFRVGDPLFQQSGAPYGQDVQTGDYNNDGKADILVATNNGIKLYMSTPTTTWTTTMVSNVYATSARFADVNGDGKLDIVANGGGVRVFYQ